MSQAVDVLIIDEPPGLDATQRAILEHEPALRTLGEDDLALAGERPVVALVFVHEDALGAGCDRIAALRDGRPWMRVLVAFRALDAGAMFRLIEAGTDAFVGRGSPAREVCATLLTLGGVTPPPERTEMQPCDTAAPCEATPDPIGLTPREAEVLRFLSAGFSNKEVARRLCLSVRTVETHRLNLRRKTQTGRLKDLVSLARQLGLKPVLDTEPARTPARHTVHAARI
ncbi:LuxR family transcriptional regulator [Methylobacterium sp. Leaf456]|uniref:response regulator transcription factor n=1 Tax=Methylobacterium sp. Leaf456 TaxID=1736382 RepID=UPI0006F3B774|nr:response regulator transcription factor [Methylobacterium sp. Leaf456]KQT45391.1 LuxR family transcriptional regulator [Methylobacterium sp. Leaf456]